MINTDYIDLLLVELIRGNYKVKPSSSFISNNCMFYYVTNNSSIIKARYDETNPFHLFLNYFRLIFNTKEDAIEHINEVVNFYKLLLKQIKEKEHY